MFYLYSFTLLFGGLSIINFIFSYQNKHIDVYFWSTLKFQLLMLPLFLIANMCIGYGVRFGYKSTENLSYVLVVAKCLEILISLIMGYIFLKEIPNWKTWGGLGVIVIGIVIMKQK
ncbi:EamA family transporter [Paenibacillus planticolens]|uniref:EamA family transporter n=1 Tax=Paenibacillus planticolens TaxID=2654976 RepID=A0ABX1ZN48_9BACL|nr:EamA family transporter [Paenibacillus planticolens]NOV01524.1 EamA family transporter [Paenibacillus planticolens]